MIKYFVSPYRDIFQNLALEDVLLRQVEEDYLFFYRNDPCFVLGKFQNIFQEMEKYIKKFKWE
ncbi:MAG: lipoyl protein ligase domain-containing protein, partial [Bacteriovoracaceae bacterium]